MDALSIVVDEVALEGLEGITLPSLWIRLEDRQPKFPLKLDESTKGFIWRALVNNAELSFYELPEEREDIELFDRYQYLDPEFGYEEKRKIFHERKDVYSVRIVPENEDGIQGSCVFFEERKNVTKQVRSKSLTPLVNMQEALESYGRKLVVVASQALRFRTLIGNENDPELKLSNESYCVLERIGRGRWQGELQSELHGDQFKMDPRKMHYLRKSLIKHDLITMQFYVKRLKMGQPQSSILLLLKRFHTNRQTKYDILMEHIADFLEQFPDQFTTVENLKEQMGLNERTLRRLFRTRYGKYVETFQKPLEDLDPSAESFTNRNGQKVLVRCIKLLKPYGRKNAADFELDDEDDDDDYSGAGGASLSEGRIMERDVLSQAYHFILSSGTKGVPQREVGLRMNLGKLEARMVLRKLHRDGMIKSFMEDEGRQRTTKFFSHKFECVSNQPQLLAIEQERNKLLHRSAPHVLQTEPASLSTLKVAPKKSCKTLSAKTNKKAGKNQNRDAKEGQQACDNHTEVKKTDGKSKEENEKSEPKKMKEEECVARNQTQPDIPTTQSAQAEDETPSCSGSFNTAAPNSVSPPTPEKIPVEEEKQSNSSSSSCLSQSEAVPPSDNPAINNIVEVENVFQPLRTYETYRLLRRKNLIIEAVHNYKILDGFFPLLKIISEDEKQDGVSSKCCKKTVLRLVHGLSRKGLVKLYTTTIIQDGITRKVDIIAHPSIQPNDERVNQLIEQIRFKLSSSHTVGRLQGAQERRELNPENPNKPKHRRYRALNVILGTDEKEPKFSPTIVPGLGKSLGFQPKMIRLRAIHSFLWYLLYGHPLRTNTSEPDSASQAPEELASSDPNAKLPEATAKEFIGEAENSNPPVMDKGSNDEDGVEAHPVQSDQCKPDKSDSDMKVYADEVSWRRFVPPVKLEKDFKSGWAMVRNLLLCLPLSVFVQFVQINYKVEGLEDYLNDPVKQHYLVRMLPDRMKRQILYKRKYVFVFHQNLEKMVYMGLLQFGVVGRFSEKDQVLVYLKRHASIVDTTTSEPHYWLVQEPPDKPFERRHYTFNSAEDVEAFWFDLMCVCLNTPLGLVRNETAAFVHHRNVIPGMVHLLKGSYEVCDDGSIPGDGRGAGGRDSELFSHLKRNWLPSCELLNSKQKQSETEAPENRLRLNSLVRKSSLRMTLEAASSLTPRYLTNKRTMSKENIETGTEPASRNQLVFGGKGQKRKKNKEVVKRPRKKKKEPQKRTKAHDAVDHQALKRMTKHRVFWSVQEDSVIMLCSVAAYVLNSKLKRPFVPYCVVRDLLHTEFDISKDKTSLAVGRRSRYILKNPQTLLNYRICLAEVHQDKALMSQLEANKPADPDEAEDCAKVFSEYVRLLRQKFSSVICERNLMIPDSQEQLFKSFKVSAIDDGNQFPSKDTINCKEDIHAIVLHNLIQSSLAMTNSQMRFSRSFQTFHTYAKYSQELLCRVFVECKKRRLYNRRHICRLIERKKNRCLPILPMSFQLSQTYYRYFQKRFLPSLCTEGFSFLRYLIKRGSGDERPATAFYHEPEIRSQTGERKTARKEKQEDSAIETAGAESADKVADSRGTTPGKEKSPESEERIENPEEHIPSDKQKKPECSAQSAADDASSSRNQTEDHQPEEPPEAAAAAVPDAPAPVSQDVPDLSDMFEYRLGSPGGSCMVSLSLMTLGLLSVHLSIPKQVVVVDSNLVGKDVVKSLGTLEDEDDDEDDDDGECDRKKGFQVTSHQASHTKYLLMRGFCSPGIVNRRCLNPNDFIVVESCIVKLKLRNTPAHHFFSDPPLALTKFGVSLLPPILTSSVLSPFYSLPSVEECVERLIQGRRYTAQDVEACAQLRRSLDEVGEKGLDERELQSSLLHLQEPRSGRTRSLQQYLKDLQEEGQVVRVGGWGVRWVLMEHAEPWLLTVNCKQMSRSHQAETRPLLTSLHNIPFARKRCAREAKQDAEGPPAKKPATDQEKPTDGETVEGRSSDVTEKPNEDTKQKGMAKDGSGDRSLDLKEKEEVQTDPEQVQTEPEHLQTDPEQVQTDPEQVQTEPEHVQTDPEHVQTDPEHVQTDPEHVQTDPEYVHTEPEYVQTEPEQEEHDGQEKMETEGQEKPKRVKKSRPSCEKDEELPYIEENWSFISRPWRFIDGKVNRPVCKGILEGVMHHIMMRPGITQQALLGHYRHALQPVAVLDILQALIDLGCITKRILVKDPKPSLFSRSAPPSRESAAMAEEPDSVFYEPTISCCLQLCRVLPNERHWNEAHPT